MANQSTFPTTLDSEPTDVTSGDKVESSTWNTYMDAIYNLETKVGIDSSAVTTSIDYRVTSLETTASSYNTHAGSAIDVSFNTHVASAIDVSFNTHVASAIDADFNTHVASAIDADFNTHVGSATDAIFNTHSSSATNVHGVTGTVVGTSDSQTLTNKIYTSSPAPEDPRPTALSGGLAGGYAISLARGTSGTPENTSYPVVYAEKICGNNWGGVDQGAAVFKAVKTSGDCFISGITGSVFYDSGYGNMVGVTGWGSVDSTLPSAGTSVWGLWGVAYSQGSGASATYATACELNVKDAGGDAGHWEDGWVEANKTRTLGLWINKMAGGYNGTLAIGVAAPATADQWHTGLLFDTDCIAGLTTHPTSGKNEHILMMGASTEERRAFGIRFSTGWFDSGIYMAGANFEYQAAITLGDSNRIYWAGTPNTYLYRNGTDVYWHDGTSAYKLNFATQVASGISNTIDTTWGAEEAQTLDIIRDALVTWGLISAS